MVVLLFLLLQCLYVAADEKLRVINPSELVNAFPPNGEIEEHPALFGLFPYGRTITAPVIYATPGDRDGCQPINKTLNPYWPPSGTPLIVMVDRGNCTFVTKVRHAQEAGAQACLIVDNVDETFIPYMADDGSGGDITIPSMLIHRADGQILKNYLSPNITVILSMTFGVPNPDNVVEWIFWTSSWDPSSVQFKSVFGTAVRALAENSTFEPRYVIFNGVSIGCTSEGQPCGNQCTNGGRYCSPDPDRDLSQGLSGADVVFENLRQICLFKFLNVTGQTLLWWNYVSQFQVDCGNDQTKWTGACGDNILTTLGINPSFIQQCVDDSGGLIAVNTLLDAEIQKLYDDGVFYMPTLIINNSPYRGTLTCPEPIDVSTCGVLEAICAGYPDGDVPCACVANPGCGLCISRDECGICGGDGYFDACHICLSPASPNFNKSCAGCDGVPNSGIRGDVCGVCNGTGSFDACARCFQAGDPRRIEPGQGGYDACGVCLPYSSSNYNKSCAGCDGVPNSGLVRDVCGVCGGTGSFDACYRCLPAGDSRRIENGQGGYDACGVCLRYSDPAFNKSCAGCDGIPNSGKLRDVCGVCAGTGSIDSCQRCLQANDPSRVDNGGYDACGACLAYGDPRRVELGSGGYDACGLCLRFTDIRFNQSCAGCDAVPNSGLTRDVCGVCGGTTDDSSNCNSGTKRLSGGSIAAIVLAIVLVMCVIIYVCVRYSQYKMRNEVDSLIQQYRALGGTNSEELIGDAPAGPNREMRPLASGPTSDS